MFQDPLPLLGMTRMFIGGGAYKQVGFGRYLSLQELQTPKRYSAKYLASQAPTFSQPGNTPQRWHCRARRAGFHQRARGQLLAVA